MGNSESYSTATPVYNFTSSPRFRFNSEPEPRAKRVRFNKEVNTVDLEGNEGTERVQFLEQKDSFVEKALTFGKRKHADLMESSQTLTRSVSRVIKKYRVRENPFTAVPAEQPVSIEPTVLIPPSEFQSWQDHADGLILRGGGAITKAAILRKGGELLASSGSFDCTRTDLPSLLSGFDGTIDFFTRPIVIDGSNYIAIKASSVYMSGIGGIGNSCMIYLTATLVLIVIYKTYLPAGRVEQAMTEIVMHIVSEGH